VCGLKSELAAGLSDLRASKISSKTFCLSSISSPISLVAFIFIVAWKRPWFSAFCVSIASKASIQSAII